MEDLRSLLIDLVKLWMKETNVNLADHDKVLILTELNTEDKIIQFIVNFKELWKENNIPLTDYEMMNFVCCIAREN